MIPTVCSVPFEDAGYWRVCSVRLHIPQRSHITSGPLWVMSILETQLGSHQSRLLDIVIDGQASPLTRVTVSQRDSDLDALRLIHTPARNMNEFIEVIVSGATHANLMSILIDDDANCLAGCEDLHQRDRVGFYVGIVEALSKIGAVGPDGVAKVREGVIAIEGRMHSG
ncbi:hypothetical protein CTheo_4579 [Ceratobasidium theobromae]|uniref:Uncharacterized protein n=1 Tax=Ceratobasidium theobromae TaxID=1582974 RepID=A0A5N5QKC7_9AGAM|nr:hypothetical protein CTheo_4579 [Ceratobasidium theobromae]